MDIKSSEGGQQLVSVQRAAAQLNVHPSTVRRHFPVVRVGDRTLIRASDIAAKFAEGGHDVA